jgi:hypothetical protein
VAGLSYRRSMGRVAVVLNFVNQLVDLSMSSGGSRDVVPGAPQDLMTPTLGVGPGNEAYGTADTKFSEQLVTDLTVDFSQAIFKCLYHVTQNNRLQVHDPRFWCGNPVTGLASELNTNTMAADVIAGTNKQVPWQGISGYALTAMNQFVTKYPLTLPAATRDRAAKAISDTIASSLAGSSLWSMLIGGLLPNFGCAVIPVAGSAIVAPLLPMSRQHYAVLNNEDYIDFDMTTMSQRPLYGVGILSNYEMGTIHNGDRKMCLGASYVPGITTTKLGMWMFANAPVWMENWTNHDPEALNGNAAVNKMLANPANNAVGANTAAVARDPSAELGAVNDAMARYAQMLYASNALRGRTGSVTGKLRFDICPGTTIKLRGKSSLGLEPGVDTLATDLLALVAGVTVAINIDGSAAATTFELTNIRTEAENESPRFSMISHPFFDTNWFKGGPLVPELSRV